MKPIITLLLLISLSLAEKPILALDIEPGYIPKAASSEYQTPDEMKYFTTSQAAVLTVKPSIDYKFFYGWFELSTFSAAPKAGVNFAPFRMSYSNEIGIYRQFPSFKLSAGWLHNCQHKIIICDYYSSSKKWNDVGYDVIFCRFHFSNLQQ